MVKLFKNLKPFTGAIILGVLCMAARGILELLLPKILSSMINNGMWIDSATQANVIDTAYILKRGTLMLALTVLSSAAGFASAIFASKVGTGFAKNIRQKLFDKVQTFSAVEMNKFGTATLINRSTNDVTQVQQIVVMLMRIAIFAPVMLIGGTIMAFSTDVRMTKVLLISVPAILIGAAIVLKIAYPVFKAIQNKTDKLTAVMRENLTGVRVIRAFVREDAEAKRFDNANKDLTKTLITTYRIMAVCMPLVNFVMNFTTIGVYYTVSKGLQTGWDVSSIGNMVAVSEYVMHIMFSILVVGMIASSIPRAAVSASRIQEVLETETTIKDKETGLKTPSGAGKVEFKNVSLKFEGAEKYALDDISFIAEAGKTTAIIGSTGSGKSTIVNLLPRFYDVTKGEVMIDDVDVREMKQQTLRSMLGIVPQKAVLFTGTIADNLKFGCPEATDAELMHAADMACASSFIMKKEDGLNSAVAQDGSNFSGGQKQRLAIARAFIGTKKIFVFDDSFSALDFKTDANVRSNIKRELSGATIIIVAQRISTVMNADNIIVLDEGKMVGSGKHKDLLKNCSIYREIALSQLDEEEM